jgi:hypothetical protein
MTMIVADAPSDLPTPSSLWGLANLSIWVSWRSEMRGAGSTKLPYAIDGAKAKSNDPST